jgi:2-polyprenyl-3-methyl-5-hydroxy-6-metoxy-1,4-benzoquinol methylase
MGKYNNILNMDTDNSASLILKNISPNTRVLEFGPGNGYMTKYMKEALNCDVAIVEIDKEDGEAAGTYASQTFIGDSFGDIEKYFWMDLGQVDHIIFSDVLEHLNNPWKVLKESTYLLKKEGSILISIPNVSHNSVIIDLINSKFNYRELGLLDNTHLRFFTRSSLLKMVSDAGLYVEQETNTFCAVEHTEFKNTFDDIPVAMADILKEREDGQLYQFVWKLKKYNSE